MGGLRKNFSPESFFPNQEEGSPKKDPPNLQQILLGLFRLSRRRLRWSASSYPEGSRWGSSSSSRTRTGTEFITQAHLPGVSEELGCGIGTQQSFRTSPNSEKRRALNVCHGTPSPETSLLPERLGARLSPTERGGILLGSSK